MEEDNLDLMLPNKKKKPKKVDFDENDSGDKDDGTMKSHGFETRDRKKGTWIIMFDP